VRTSLVPALAFFAVACGGAATTPTPSPNDPNGAAIAVPPPTSPTAKARVAPPEPALPDGPGTHAAAATTEESLTAQMREHLVGLAAEPLEPDGVLYREGNERMLAGDMATARRKLFELIQKFPNSRLVPYAYLGFAEGFLAEGATDASKYALAQQGFEKVTQYPPPLNHAYAYAWHRLGRAFAGMNDAAHAARAEQRAIDAAKQNPGLPLAAETAELARTAR